MLSTDLKRGNMCDIPSNRPEKVQARTRKSQEENQNQHRSTKAEMGFAEEAEGTRIGQ